MHVTGDLIVARAGGGAAEGTDGAPGGGGGGEQLGDLTLALDELSKELVCKLTGKTSYEFGDLSIVIDTRCARDCGSVWWCVDGSMCVCVCVCVCVVGECGGDG